MAVFQPFHADSWDLVSRPGTPVAALSRLVRGFESLWERHSVAVDVTSAGFRPIVRNRLGIGSGFRFDGHQDCALADVRFIAADALVRHAPVAERREQAARNAGRARRGKAMASGPTTKPIAGTATAAPTAASTVTSMPTRPPFGPPSSPPSASRVASVPP